MMEEKYIFLSSKKIWWAWFWSQCSYICERETRAFSGIYRNLFCRCLSEQRRRKGGRRGRLHFNHRATLKKHHPFSPKHSCRTETLTRANRERQVSGTNSVQGESRGKAKSPAVQGMRCLAGAPAAPALGPRVGGWRGVSGEPLITAGRAATLPGEQCVKASLQPCASREPRCSSKNGQTIMY